VPFSGVDGHARGQVLRIRMRVRVHLSRLSFDLDQIVTNMQGINLILDSGLSLTHSVKQKKVFAHLTHTLYWHDEQAIVPNTSVQEALKSQVKPLPIPSPIFILGSA